MDELGLPSGDVPSPEDQDLDSIHQLGDVSVPIAEDLVAQLKKGGFLKKGAEREVTALLKQRLAAIQGHTHTDVAAAVEVEEKRELTPAQKETLLANLKARFQTNTTLHPKVQWLKVESALRATNQKILFGLFKMEETGGEPDVIMVEPAFLGGAFIFGDCSRESPPGRRNVVFDKAAEADLDKGTFDGNAVDMAAGYGVDLMSKLEYKILQQLHMHRFDARTYSWLKTPRRVREAGAALRGDYHHAIKKVTRGGRHRKPESTISLLLGAAFKEKTNVQKVHPADHNNSTGFRCVVRVPKKST